MAQDRLREGIEAARRGDKIAARRLLQQVISADRNNELAWMWMASVVDSPAEKRSCLERVLQINPNNERAREALQRMGVTPRGASGTPIAAVAEPRPRTDGGGPNIFFILAGLVAVVLVIVVVVALANQQGTTLSPQDNDATFAALVVSQTPAGTATPNPDITPTETPLVGVLVTIDPNVNPLPPTFTPTTPPTALPSATPTPTPLPLSSLRVAYTAFEPAAPQPSLFIGTGDASGQPVAGGDQGYFDVAISPDGEQIAFVRIVNIDALLAATEEATADATEEASTDEEATPEPTNPPPPVTYEMFVAPINDLTAAQPITGTGATMMSGPSWSPDGTQLAFMSNHTGSEEIYVVSASGGDLRALTDNFDAVDRDPAWSPDGESIAFASDVQSPGFTEIYVIPAEGGEPTRLTEGGGNSYAPAWSPDGTAIAFVSDRTGDGDIYTMDATGTRRTTITLDDDGAEDMMPAWSPDGRLLVFASNREDDRFQWYAADISDLLNIQITRINDDDNRAQSWSFSPAAPN